MLVSSQTAMKGGHGFEIAIRVENLRGGDWDETKWRPSCSKYALEIELVFGCFFVFDIANTAIHTWKECKNTSGHVRISLLTTVGLLVGQLCQMTHRGQSG